MVLPVMPAMKVWVCKPLLPSRMVFDSVEGARADVPAEVNIGVAREVISKAAGEAGFTAQGGIAGALTVFQGVSAHRGVVVAGGVVRERTAAGGGVVVAGGVGEERIRAAGGVVVAGGVGIERPRAAGGVVVAGGVGAECTRAAGGVEVAGGVGRERPKPLAAL